MNVLTLQESIKSLEAAKNSTPPEGFEFDPFNENDGERSACGWFSKAQDEG